MKICLLNGGLANQMFQYVFGRYIEEMVGESVYYDDSYFFIAQVETDQYSLERVFPNIKKPLLLSEYYDSETWMYMIKEKKDNGRLIPQQLYENGMKLRLVTSSKNCKFSGDIVKIKHNSFDPNIANIQGNVYYNDYWGTSEWFKAIKNILIHEFTFPKIMDIQESVRNQHYYQIINSNSVGVHIRRGDFVTLGQETSSAYYHWGIKRMVKQIENAKLFIFSDDIAWCKKNEKKLGIHFAKDSVVYVDDNDNVNDNYIDMQMLSVCKHLLAGNSGFSYMASLLNRNKPRVEIALFNWHKEKNIIIWTRQLFEKIRIKYLKKVKSIFK